MEEELKGEKVKELITRNFLERELKFGDFPKVVGLEKTEEIKKAKELLEAIIESAKEESA